MDKKTKEIHDKLKKLQVGDYLDLDDVEVLESDKDHLRAARTFFTEVIEDAEYFTHNPSIKRMEERKQFYRKKLSELEEKKKRGEDTCQGKFTSTEFFESHRLNDKQIHIILMLMSRRGIGVRTLNTQVSGEVLIMAVKLLVDIDVEDARKLLTGSSLLRTDEYISSANRRRGHSHGWDIRRIDRRREKSSIEETHFELSDWCVDAIYGETTTEPTHSQEEGSEDELLVKIEPDVELSDVVLPVETKESVLSLLEQYRNKEKFMDEWNMKSILGDRKGLNMLLSGAPGTGKTMLAKGLAQELDMNLYMVSFADMVDCFYGNTEKNASRMFNILKSGKNILLLDEADAILQQRSPSRTSCDRSENRVINIVLQELENHSGLIIFTTNISIGLDRAMERRLDLKLELPVPDLLARKKIWQHHIPKELPLNEEVDIEKLAESYEFSGGQIRNAVLSAARTAMRRGQEDVGMENFLQACEEEIKGSKAMSFFMTGSKEEDVRGYT